MAASEDGAAFEEGIVRLVDDVRRNCIEVRPGAVGLLTSLSCLIDRWNKVVNLVSRKDIDRLVSYHFCDSASVLPILKPSREIATLDIGGSNGLPGLVLSALSPRIRLKVCDSRIKRRAFMEEACRELNVGAQFELARVDGQRFQADHHEFFDLIVARAVTGLRTLFRWCMPLLKPGGRIVAYKGSRCLEEVRQAESYLLKGGGSLLAVMGSPWAHECNPLRMFAIAGKGHT